MMNDELLNSICFMKWTSHDQPINLYNLINIKYKLTSQFGLINFLPGYIQSPSCHWINFSRSGLQPRHLISRLKTAPTSLVLALSINSDFFISNFDSTELVAGRLPNFDFTLPSTRHPLPCAMPFPINQRPDTRKQIIRL